jgi:hypothetical protein
LAEVLDLAGDTTALFNADDFATVRYSRILSRRSFAYAFNGQQQVVNAFESAVGFAHLQDFVGGCRADATQDQS